MAKFRYSCQKAQTTSQDMPLLSELNPENDRVIIVKSRERDGLRDGQMGDNSNATDEGFAFLLAQPLYFSLRKELVDFAGAMNADEQRKLIVFYLISGMDFPIEIGAALSPRRRHSPVRERLPLTGMSFPRRRGRRNPAPAIR